MLSADRGGEAEGAGQSCEGIVSRMLLASVNKND